ncbi:hypothetical protein [Bacillus sp. PS06]|uniref:hypothetical protein n=1 Tax=Bacillus sp. PS06 TaxID=2764176 RepID=UPI001780FEB7|nr:hypothetical protein [Bacillus sp. PS06]MBD8069813.1 hypothetical protein [Bacillus sp. PS06]
MLNKLLKEYNKVYSFHNTIVDGVIINKWFIIFIILIIFEAILIGVFLTKNLLIAFVIFIIYFTTVFFASLWNRTLIKKQYGSVETYNLRNLERFIKNVKDGLGIDLINENINHTIEGLIKDELSHSISQESIKKSFSQGVIISLIPLAIQFFITSQIIFIQLALIALGVIVIIYSIKLSLVDYSKQYRLKEFSFLLKEIRIKKIYQ